MSNDAAHTDQTETPAVSFAKRDGVYLDSLMVRDYSTNNPHLVKIVDGEKKALCNARYRVWSAGTVAEDLATGEQVWSWAACPRCTAKAEQAVRTSN